MASDVFEKTFRRCHDCCYFICLALQSWLTWETVWTHSVWNWVAATRGGMERCGISRNHPSVMRPIFLVNQTSFWKRRQRLANEGFLNICLTGQDGYDWDLNIKNHVLIHPVLYVRYMNLLRWSGSFTKSPWWQLHLIFKTGSFATCFWLRGWFLSTTVRFGSSLLTLPPGGLFYSMWFDSASRRLECMRLVMLSPLAGWNHFSSFFSVLWGQSLDSLWAAQDSLLFAPSVFQSTPKPDQQILFFRVQRDSEIQCLLQYGMVFLSLM